MINDKIGERVKELRTSKHLSQIEFSKHLGISQGFLSDLENGKSSPNSEILLSIKRLFPDVSSDWLLTGEGEMFRGNGNSERVRAEPSPPASISDQFERRLQALETKIAQITQIPKVSADNASARKPSDAVELPFFTEAVAAGVPTSVFGDNVERLIVAKSFVKRPSKCFAVRAIGDSMVGSGIESGDILVVEREKEPTNGKIAIVRLNGTGLTVKRLKIVKKGDIYLEPSNKSHKSIKLKPENEADLLGIVILVIREM